jgi:hypothetical protein
VHAAQQPIDGADATSLTVRTAGRYDSPSYTHTLALDLDNAQ